MRASVNPPAAPAPPPRAKGKRAAPVPLPPAIPDKKTTLRGVVPKRGAKVEKVEEEPIAPAEETTAVPEAEEASEPSIIAGEASGAFDEEFAEKCRVAMGAKLSEETKRDIKKYRAEVDKQTGALKGLLKDLMARKDGFVEKCVAVEAQLRQQAATAVAGEESAAAVKGDLEARLGATASSLASAEAAASAAEQRNIAFATDKEKMAADLAVAVAARDNLMAEVTLVKISLEGVQAEAKQFRGEVERANTLRSETALRHTNELEALRIEHEAAKTQLKSVHEDEVKSFRQQLQSVALKLANTESEGKDVSRDRDSLREQLAAATGDATAVKAQLRELEGRFQKLEMEKGTLEMLNKEYKGQMAEKDSAYAAHMTNSSRMQEAYFKHTEDARTKEDKLRADVDAMRALKETAEERVRALTRELEDTKAALATSQSTAARLDAELNAARVERASAEGAWTATKAALETTRDELTANVARLEGELGTTTTERDSLAGAKAALTTERDTLVTKTATLETQNATLTGAFNDTKAKLEDVSQELHHFKENCGATNIEQLENLVSLQKERDVLLKQVAGKESILDALTRAEKRVVDLEAAVFEGEATRRRLHNKIQELRGNVRVVSRVRPFMSGEEKVGTIACSPDGESLRISMGQGVTHNFGFDKAFECEATQAAVFEEVSDLVQSALDGYNVCLFSYGQTGAGKTHTMQGDNFGEQRGIIPRSMEKLMEAANTLKVKGWEYTMEVTFCEIYNEELRDLLAPKEKPVPKGADPKTVPKKLPLNIRHEGGQTIVDGITRHPVDDSGAIAALMERAGQRRSVAATNMNAHSSRSHSIFTLHLRGVNAGQKTELRGSLNLCDLAGSERLSRSGAASDPTRLKETQAINKSLSSLSDVFVSLSAKSAHIPYRNSKLTYLLQNSFSGDGKTLMIVNLSPTVESAGESLCSLRFAAKVNNTELGRPKQRVRVGASTPDMEASDECDTTDDSAAATAAPSGPAAAPAVPGGAALDKSTRKRPHTAPTSPQRNVRQKR